MMFKPYTFSHWKKHDLFCLFCFFCSFRMFTSLVCQPEAQKQGGKKFSIKFLSRRVEESQSPRVESTLSTMGASRSMAQDFRTKVGSGLRQTSGVHGLFRGQWRSVTKICRTGRTASELNWSPHVSCFAEMSLRREKNLLCLICAA